MVNKQIELFDLSNERVYVKIQQSAINNFFSYAVKFAGSESKLAKLLGVKRIGNIWYYKNCKMFTPLQLIVQILNILPEEKRNELKKQIEQNLEEIRYGYGNAKSIKTPNFPIKFSTTLARICGHLTGDGGVRQTNGDYAVYYTNKCNFLVNQFKTDTIETFGNVDVYDYCNKRDGTRMVRFPSIVGLILNILFGPMVGDLKHTPDLILNSDKVSKILFLRALFDDEGCVSSKRVCLSVSNEGIIKESQIILKELGISTGKISSREATETWKQTYGFGVFGRKDLHLFFNIVSFDHPKKKAKLEKLIDKYKNKKEYYKKGEIRTLILDTLKTSPKNVYELAEDLNRKPSYRFREQLYKLEKCKMIKVKSIKRRMKIYYLAGVNYEISKKS